MKNVVQKGFTPLQRKLNTNGKSSFVTGFTFIEVIIAIGILSIMGLAVYSIFASGMKVWRRVETLDISQRKAFLALEKVAGELRCSLDFPDIGFNGEEDQLSFPLLVDKDIAKIIFVFDSYEKAIFRQETTYQDIIDEEEVEPISKKILSLVTDLKFSYYFFNEEAEEYQYKDSWSSEDDGIPLRIRIELTIQDETFNKVVWIPIS